MNSDDDTMRRSGVWRTADLYAAGLTKRQVWRAVDSGRLTKLRQGVYCFGVDQATMTAARHGGAVTCASALRAHGVWTLDDERRVHVALRAGARHHSHEDCRCVVHRDTFSTSDDIGDASNERTNEFGVVPVRVALVHASRCLSDEAFFAALESALNQRLIDATDRRWVRRHVTTRLRALVDFARTDAESGLESLVRLRLHRFGIPVRTQVRIATVGRVDLLMGDVIIELDGAQNHAAPAHRHRDLRRDAAAIRLGYRPLRFDYAMVVHDWPIVRDTILATL